MSLKFNQSKSVIEILNGTSKEILANIDMLAKLYLEKTGRKVCRTCPSDIRYMILSLKNELNMSKFKFKRHAAMYKNKKGDRVTISNSVLSSKVGDERAIEFLKHDPKRIRLFSDYPSNWEDLIKGKKETEADKDKRLAIEAELELAKKAAEEKAAEEKSSDKKEDKKEDSVKPSKDELMKLTLKELRLKYPEVKARTPKEFVDKVLAL